MLSNESGSVSGTAFVSSEVTSGSISRTRRCSWSVTIDEREQGWLTDLFHARFREVLTHTSFRYDLVVPSYVLMPDHFHLMIMGTHDSTDQRVAMRYFRKQLNWILKPGGFKLQKQGYDHVIRDESRRQNLFETIVAYVRENPMRARMVEDHAEYRFAGCLVPGYPELDVWAENFWDSFWKLYWRQRDKGS